MQNDAEQLDRKLTSLGAALHVAALQSKAEIDAIPSDASVNDESAIIDAAIAPACCLAEHILGILGKAKPQSLSVRALRLG